MHDTKKQIIIKCLKYLILYILTFNLTISSQNEKINWLKT